MSYEADEQPEDEPVYDPYAVGPEARLFAQSQPPAEGSYQCPFCELREPHVHATDAGRECPHCGTPISAYAFYCVKCERSVLVG